MLFFRGDLYINVEVTENGFKNHLVPTSCLGFGFVSLLAFLFIIGKARNCKGASRITALCVGLIQ